MKQIDIDSVQQTAELLGFENTVKNIEHWKKENMDKSESEKIDEEVSEEPTQPDPFFGLVPIADTPADLIGWSAERWRRQAIAHYVSIISTETTQPKEMATGDIANLIAATRFCLDMAVHRQVEEDKDSAIIRVRKGLVEAAQGKTVPMDFSDLDRDDLAESEDTDESRTTQA